MLVSSPSRKKKSAGRDPCDTDKSCFFYKPHSIWLICPVVLIPGLGWLNLSISFSYQRPNRSTAGHWTKTRVLLLHRKSQRLRTGRGEVYQDSSLQGLANKAKSKSKKSPLCCFKEIFPVKKKGLEISIFHAIVMSVLHPPTHTHTLLSRILE